MRNLTRLFHRFSRVAPAISSMVLAFVAGLTLLMPVNYRAGTDYAHAHTIFQIWIDAASGRSHHHVQNEQVDAGHETSNADAHALQLPHVHAPNGEAVILGDASVTQQPDNAEPVTTSMPIQHANSLGVLSVLIAMLLADIARRPQWANGRRLFGVVRIPDPPPPRLAPR